MRPVVTVAMHESGEFGGFTVDSLSTIYHYTSLGQLFGCHESTETVQQIFKTTDYVAMEKSNFNHRSADAYFL